MTTPEPALRMLMVDDHEPFRVRVRSILQGCSRIRIIAEAAHVQEALAALRSGPFDVVTLDLSLGDENGLDLLHTIRALHPQLPVLMLTLRAGEEYAAYTRSQGALGFLRKELAGSELLNALREVMSGRYYDSEMIVPAV